MTERMLTTTLELTDSQAVDQAALFFQDQGVRLTARGGGKISRPPQSNDRFEIIGTNNNLLTVTFVWGALSLNPDPNRSSPSIGSIKLHIGSSNRARLVIETRWDYARVGEPSLEASWPALKALADILGLRVSTEFGRGRQTWLKPQQIEPVCVWLATLWNHHVLMNTRVAAGPTPPTNTER